MAFTVQQYDILRETALSGKVYVWNRLVDENNVTIDFQLKFHDEPTVEDIVAAADQYATEYNERLAAEAAAQQGV